MLNKNNSIKNTKYTLGERIIIYLQDYDKQDRVNFFEHSNELSSSYTVKFRSLYGWSHRKTRNWIGKLGHNFLKQSNQDHDWTVIVE